MMSNHVDIVLRDDYETVKWKIKLFFDVTKNLFYSPNFLFSQSTCYLQILSTGGKDPIDWLSLHLCTRNKYEKIVGSYIIGVKKLDGSVFKSFTGETTSDGQNYEFVRIDEFVQMSELQQSKDVVAPDGTLTVFFTFLCGYGRAEEAASHTSQSEFSLDGLAPRSSATESLETLSRNYKDLFLSGCQGDVKINIEDREFHVHKLVLTVRSPVFAKMFDHNMAENNSGVVHIADCEPDTFEDFLYFVYSGDLDRVSPNNALSLYTTAEKYDLNDLKKACSKCLASNLLVDSICDVIHLAVLHDDSELLETATDYFMNNANAIFSTSKWQKFMKEETSIANELIIKTLNRNSIKY